MSEAEVAEAIVEAETEQPEQPVDDHGFDMDAAADELAKDLFPHSEKEDEVVEEAEEVVEEVEEAEAEEPEKVEEEIKPPQSWKKEMHESWGKLDKDTREYIELREEQMKEGVEVKKTDADLGMKVRDAFAPFDNILKKNNIDPVNAAQRMLGIHLRIASAQPEEKKQLFDQLAKSYGITNEPVDAETKKMMDNPMVQQLLNKVNQLEQNQNMSQQATQQERETQINSEVEAFASKHDHFDDLSDEIAKLIRADYSLEDAYNVAYKVSPFFEKDLDKEREKKQIETEKAKKIEAEKAKKAKSVNVRGRDTKKAPTAPKGTMEDTMHEVMREINNRA